jgi:ribosomal-protein-alanine N-acetyltransferase
VEDLSTERLDMRPFTLADLGPVHELYADPDAMRYSGGTSKDADESARRLQRLIDHQEKLGFSLWAVIERESASVIGYCGLIPYAHRGPEIELAYALQVPYWGRGYATESARAWLAHGFGPLGLEQVVGIAHEDNGASRRVLEKLGMRLDGRVDYGGQTMLRYVADRPST